MVIGGGNTGWGNNRPVPAAWLQVEVKQAVRKTKEAHAPIHYYTSTVPLSYHYSTAVLDKTGQEAAGTASRDSAIGDHTISA